MNPGGIPNSVGTTSSGVIPDFSSVTLDFGIALDSSIVMNLSAIPDSDIAPDSSSTASSGTTPDSCMAKSSDVAADFCANSDFGAVTGSRNAAGSGLETDHSVSRCADWSAVPRHYRGNSLYGHFGK